jgi:hypothetical protein
METGIQLGGGGPASTMLIPPSGSGIIVGDPQTLGMPAPPHVSPATGHVVGPQATRLPQPSAMLPQFIASPPSVGTQAWVTV